MIRKICFCLVFPLLICSVTSGQAIRPYLQSPSDTSIVITWKTSSNPESKVIYGNDSVSMHNQVNGSCEILSDVGYNNNYYYHSVRLNGLEPNHFYYYRIITGNLQSAAYRFRTQPVSGEKPAIYRFLIFGDHQIGNNDHYERLMKAAREKVVEKYGGTIEEHINLIINDGDQVDQGTLEQYEHIHFEPSAVLSGNIPIMTTVGNHETYGSLGLSAYYQHFFYDDLGYKGIVSPGGENYYSYQQGNIVFLHLSTEHTTDAQINWVRQVVDAVKSDPSVNWLVSVAHRPIQAEQYVGDISVYVRDKIMPVLTQTEKSVLLITGHHHLYARGQLRDYPMYHIISGAASWDQYWGQSVEKDFDDVQKTIDYWTYQIATFDNSKNEMSVESYAIGSPKLGLALNNELIDSFYRKPGAVPPSEPSVITQPTDTITLPFTFESSPFSTTTSEPINSTQFQISSDSNFSVSTVDLIRDYENLYGTTGTPDYRPVDINKGINIIQYNISGNKLPNGTWYIRTRHRDRNIEWSEWSGFVKFIVKGSVIGTTSISTPKTIYKLNESIIVNFQFGPGNTKDWIGIYKIGETPGTTPSTEWAYTSGSSGSLNLQVAEAGKYFIAFFENEGYTELAERISIYVSTVPVLSLSKAGFNVGEGIKISYSNAPGFPNDWIGIYKLNDSPGNTGSTLWEYTSGTSGNIDFAGLPAGYYYTTYFLEDGYSEACERIAFSVGSDLAVVSTDETSYFSGQSIKVNFENGPGTPKDWIGLFRQNSPPGIPPLVFRQFIENQQSGSLSFDLTLDPGEYSIAMYINNSSVRISNKIIFIVEASTSVTNLKPASDGVVVFPSPSNGLFKVKIPGVGFNKFSLKIVSTSGMLVFEKQMKSNNSGYSEEIDISVSPPGIYFLRLQSESRVFVQKLVLK